MKEMSCIRHAAFTINEFQVFIQSEEKRTFGRPKYREEKKMKLYFNTLRTGDANLRF